MLPRGRGAPSLVLPCRGRRWTGGSFSCSCGEAWLSAVGVGSTPELSGFWRGSLGSSLGDPPATISERGRAGFSASWRRWNRQRASCCGGGRGGGCEIHKPRSLVQQPPPRLKGLAMGADMSTTASYHVRQAPPLPRRRGFLTIPDNLLADLYPKFGLAHFRALL